MPVITKRWEVASPPPPEAIQELSGYPQIIQYILFNRDITTLDEAIQYLDAKTPPEIESKKIRNIPKAIDRIQRAIRHKEKIAVYGDYDADGVTATVLLVLVLKSLDADVREYIPKRQDEGYGLNLDALHTLKEQGINLIITVDCGIRSFAEADFAHTAGIDLIITDHHLPFETLPAAFAVINPKQHKDNYPEKNLSGVGLAYKLAEALLNLNPKIQNDPCNYLDLVAIGTVADMVPLRGENRSLVRAGLNCIRQRQRQGLFSLMNVAGVKPRDITATAIGFFLGPRLNAAGRLETALSAFKLLTTQDVQQAGQLSQWLEVQNRERQKITRSILEKAEQLAFIKDKNPFLIFVADEDFNPGVVGLAASRLTEQYYRPSIIASKGDKYTRGSCRSIPEFHITEALDQCKDLLDHHGGHAAAAGFTVSNENLPVLIEKMQKIAAEQLADVDLRPKIYADMEISLSELTFDLLKYLDRLQPTGMDNPEPIFVSRGLRIVSQKTVGVDASHLKLKVTDGKRPFDAIAFRQGHWLTKLPKMIDLIYSFERNEYNGLVSLQLNIKDIKESEH